MNCASRSVDYERSTRSGRSRSGGDANRYSLCSLHHVEILLTKLKFESSWSKAVNASNKRGERKRRRGRNRSMRNC